MMIVASKRRQQRGFTLLEVLVAVAILGLSLTAILSAQFSAVKRVQHSRHMSVALGLARCKMTELEDQLRIDGFNALDENGAGPCCEGDEGNRMTCEWRIEKPVFPDPNYGQLDLDAGLESSPLGDLAAGAASGALPESGDTAELAESMAGGGVGGIVSMVMEMVYPDIKAIFEASARRVTLVLTWSEGAREYDVELVQWVTQPQPGLVVVEEEE